MTKWAWLALNNVAAISAGAYLVSHDCPWWGLPCFLMIEGASCVEKRAEG